MNRLSPVGTGLGANLARQFHRLVVQLGRVNQIVTRHGFAGVGQFLVEGDLVRLPANRDVDRVINRRWLGQGDGGGRQENDDAEGGCCFCHGVTLLLAAD
ncbi:MAG: hypothetical protein V9H26_09985 [Verrucomicrobiota bacterium]